MNPIPTTPEGMITTREAAEIAGKHQRTIVAWIHRGLIPAVKVPGGRGAYYMKPDDLHAALKHMFTPVPYTPRKR